MDENYINQEYNRGKSWAKAFLDEQEKREKEKKAAQAEKLKKQTRRKLIMTVSSNLAALAFLYLMYKAFLT